MKKRLIIALLALVGLLPANAQYRFTIDGGFSGDCAKVSGVAELNQQLQMLKGQVASGFPDKASCEQARAAVNSIKAQAEMITYDARTGKVIDRRKYNCSFSMSASPCTGRPLSGGLGNAGGLGGSSVGNPNVQGVGQGNSFYSTNGANDIRDWSNDDMERMLALNPNYKDYSLDAPSSGDANMDAKRALEREHASWTLDDSKPFVSLDMRPGGSSTIISEDLLPLEERPANSALVNSYLDRIDLNRIPEFATGEEYIQWIKDKFKEISGYDIDAVSAKYSMTDAEKQLVANYRDFFKGVTDKITDDLENIKARSMETTVFEMSVLSDDCYGGSDYMTDTNYRKIEDLPEDNSMKGTLNILNMFEGQTGFNAELYYNNKLDEYTIAFEGSQMNPLHLADFVNDWWNTNKRQGLGIGDVPDQYKMAAYIADHLPKDAKINFTGHSLGGGLASLCGAITGKPTYTFNAEGVNDNILKACNLPTDDVTKFSNIKAYHTSNDLLSNTQDVTGGKKAAPAIGERINIGNLQTKKEELLYSTVGAAAGGSVLPGLGNVVGREVARRGMAHKVTPMEKYFKGVKEQKQTGINEILVSLNNERSRTAMRTLDSIQINIK